MINVRNIYRFLTYEIIAAAYNISRTYWKSRLFFSKKKFKNNLISFLLKIGFSQTCRSIHQRAVALLRLITGHFLGFALFVKTWPLTLSRWEVATKVNEGNVWLSSLLSMNSWFWNLFLDHHGQNKWTKSSGIFVICSSQKRDWRKRIESLRSVVLNRYQVPRHAEENRI